MLCQVILPALPNLIANRLACVALKLAIHLALLSETIAMKPDICKHWLAIYNYDIIYQFPHQLNLQISQCEISKHKGPIFGLTRAFILLSINAQGLPQQIKQDLLWTWYE